MTTCQMSVELGAYVLHALENDEDDQVRRHVADCDQCRDEVRELSFTASLLSLLTLEDFEQLDVYEEVRPYDAPARRRPRRRTVLAAAAAALVVLVAAPVARQLAGPTTPPATTIQAADPATRVEAAVTLWRHESGTRVHLDLSGGYPQGWCSLVARSRDGSSDVAATWRADRDGVADVSGMTAIPTTRLSELDVVTDTGRVLVTIPVQQHDS